MTPPPEQLTPETFPPPNGRASKDDLDDNIELTGFDETEAVEFVFNLKKIQRKVDWHIAPIMFLCYTAQFVDKVSLNYSRVMGLEEDLSLQGNEFSNAATAFFAAYLIAEVATGVSCSIFIITLDGRTPVLTATN